MQQNSYLWCLTNMRLGAVIGLMFLFGLGYTQVPETNPTFNFGNHWIFGKNIHLEFAENQVKESFRTDIDFLEGTSSISDSFGNLLYYITDGSFNSFVANSKGLKLSPKVKGDPSASQGFIFINHLESDTIFLLNSARTDNAFQFLVYSDSILVSFKLFPFLGGEKQQAVNHQNGRDVWYANHAQNGDSIYFFLIKKNGMVECPVVTHTGLHYYGGDMGWSTQGQMKFSPNGRYLAEAVSSSPFGYGVYRFNSEYPTNDSFYSWSKGFTPDYTKSWPYGVEFSPDGSKVYFSAGRANDIQEPNHPPVVYQLSIDSLPFDDKGSTWISIDSLWGVEDGALQLAPNGKIYCARPNQTYLSVINDPNELGTACNYQRQGLTLDSGGTCLYGLPTFNQSYFYTPQIDYRYEENCVTNEYEFWGADTFGAINFSWKFRDIRNETIDIRLGKNISYSFPNADSLENKYEVTFVANNGSKTDSVTKTLTIRPKMQTYFLGRDTFYCQGDTAFSISLQTPPNLHCIHWNGLEPYSSYFMDTIIGYENFYGHITENTHRTIDTAGIYTARITNKTFCQVTDTIVVAEKPRPTKGEVSRSGSELVSSVAAYEYKWYCNDSLISISKNLNFLPSKNGYWQVQLISEFGCESEFSDSILVDFASIDPRLQDTGQLTFKIYPNPSGGKITIELGKKLSDIKIEVLDLNGKVVHRQHSKNSEIVVLDLDLAAGTYSLQLTDENGNVGVKKVVVE